MTSVTVQKVQARKLAAVRRSVTVGSIGTVWRPALDEVWEFLRANPGLRTDGHNIFLYHHPASPADPVDVDFGVEVIRAFDQVGEVGPAETPAGEVAQAVHVGGYDQLHRAHDAIQEWQAAEGATFAGTSWEIYGDWSDDPSEVETTVCYLLA